jgi:hypothetical protein
MKTKTEHTILGIAGTLERDELNSIGLYRRQKWTARRKRGKEIFEVVLRFDDQCGNRHMDFSVTGTLYENGKDVAGGCLHEDVARFFPKLAPLIKWHLVATDQPMHYIANTVYHASNRDHNGLLKGERRQIRNGRTGELAWKLAAVDAEGNETENNLSKYADGNTRPEGQVTLRYVPWCHEGEGKAREFDHARSSAVWPEATDEQLSVSPEELTAALTARLPALMAEFKRDMVDVCGFDWREPKK